MSKLPAPSDLADKFMLRLPDGMREQVKTSANENGRSMNAEIVYRLAEAYAMEELRRYKPSNPVKFPDGSEVWVERGPDDSTATDSGLVERLLRDVESLRETLLAVTGRTQK